jgi:hypothetical protein
LWRFNAIKFLKIHNNILEIKWFISIHWESLTRSKSEGVFKSFKLHRNSLSKDSLRPGGGQIKWVLFLQPILEVKSLTLQEILAFLTGNFDKKIIPYDFFAPMSNLTKVWFWTSQFGLDHFVLVFFIGLFLPSFFY